MTSVGGGLGRFAHVQGVLSFGGGRGTYRVLDGDVPIALFSKMTLNPVDLADNVEASSLQTPGTDLISIHTDASCGLSGKLGNFRVLSWNIAVMKDDSIDNIVSQLRGMREDWDAILIQEGPRSVESSLGTLSSGHIWYVAPCSDRPRSIAILIHRRWSHLQLVFVSVSGRVAYVDCKDDDTALRVIAAHLPHGGDSDIEFDATLFEASAIHSDAKQKRLITI